MDAVTNRIVDLADIDPTFAWRLLARLDAARSWDARFGALDEAFLERLADSYDPAAPDLLARLSSRQGEVGDLASEIGRSHRSLIARFRVQVGLPPKSAARLLRFNRALAALNEAQGPRWPEGKPYLEGRVQAVRVASPVRADLAVGCGYYDQAHFINEFRSFAGCTPAAFVRGLGREPVAA